MTKPIPTILTPVPEGAVVIPDFPDYAITATAILYSRKLYGSRSRRLGPWYAIKPKLDPKGYLFVKLFRHPLKPQEWRLHRLVLLAFIGPAEAGQDGRHLDDNRLNNNLDNLSYGTRSQNLRDAVRNGCIKVNEESCHAKLSNEEVLTIRQLGRDGLKNKVIAAQFGINYKQVWAIIRGKSWKHLPV